MLGVVEWILSAVERKQTGVDRSVAVRLWFLLNVGYHACTRVCWYQPFFKGNPCKYIELKYIRDCFVGKSELRKQNQNDDAVYEGTGTGEVKHSIASCCPCIMLSLNANETMLPMLFSMISKAALLLTPQIYTP